MENETGWGDPALSHRNASKYMTLLPDPRLGVLAVLLVAAAVSDVRTHRIPNALVFGGALYGLAYHAFFPPVPGEAGILVALGGLGVGLAGLLPLYLLRVMGAGDVKLMAMAGAFLGASGAFCALLATLVAGGVLAIAFTLATGRVVAMLRNVLAVCRGTMVSLATGVGGLAVHDGPSAGRMPYAVAIAAGTIAYLIAVQFGWLKGA